ncbi:hypothetical protein [Pseudomarimonas arenosa]|nr:hypothetical protein [Pseudomarimonas arenosa]
MARPTDAHLLDLLRQLQAAARGGDRKAAGFLARFYLPHLVETLTGRKAPH